MNICCAAGYKDLATAFKRAPSLLCLRKDPYVTVVRGQMGPVCSFRNFIEKQYVHKWCIQSIIQSVLGSHLHDVLTQRVLQNYEHECRCNTMYTGSDGGRKVTKIE